MGTVLFTAHSPAPWSVGERRDKLDNLPILDAAGEVIGAAQDFNCYDLDALVDANARLFAAAPDLLDFAMSVENDDGRIPAPLWEMRNKAIAKAHGGTP